MRHTEDNLQAACVTWFRAQYPTRLLFAIPNGGARSAITGAMLKRSGVIAGIPDLFLACPSNGHSGLFIEMKRPKEKGKSAGKPSPEQVLIIAHLRNQGYKVEICDSIGGFMDVVNEYLNAYLTTRMR